MTTGPVTADDLAAAVAGCVEALRAGVDADWSVPAGVLEWSCRDTAEHLADDLFCYAVQLAPAPVPADRMVAFDCHPREPSGPELSVRPDPQAGAPGLLEIIAASGALLVAMVTVAPPDRRGHHVFGPADAQASAAMGIIETVGTPTTSPRGLARLMPAAIPATTRGRHCCAPPVAAATSGRGAGGTEPYCP